MHKHFSLLAALWALAFGGIVQAAPTCTPISIAPNTALASGTAGTSYGPVTFTASGSSATPYVYDISSGLPAGSGLTLNSANGQLSGAPLQAGSFLMTVTATDTNGCSGGRTYALDVAVGDQTITFTSVPPGSAVVGGATYNVTATATSGLPVTFTIDATASSVCSIAGSTVSFIGVGNCVIDANQSGNASFNAAPQAQQNFAVGKGSQTITFTSVPPSNPPIGGPTYNVTATATSGLPVTFTIDATASSVCSIAGNTVSFTGSGNCVIDANQAGDANWNAAPQAQQTFGVAKKSQTITFTSTAPAAAKVGGTTYNVTATATSGLAVTFTIDATASSVCSIAGSTVSFIGAGTCVIDANQAGDATYGAAPQQQQSFAVGKGDQTITYTSVPPGSASVGGATYNVTATASSGLAVTFTIDATASSICSITGNTVSFIGVGTCVVDANQAGNANYNAAPQQQQSFAVAKGTQTINFTSVPPASPVVGGPTYTVTATATSGLAVTLTIDATATSVCSIAGSTVSFLTVGTCVIDANQAGDANYNAAAQAQQSFLIGKGNQTITFTSVPPGSPVVGGPTYNVTATSNSGLAVTFTIDATASTVCSIAGSTVSFIGQGTCVIDANQAGDANWNAAPQAQQSFGVNKTNQTITFTSSAPVGAVVAGPTYTVTATASSGLTVTFTIDASASAICSIAGSTVSFIGAGTCVIDANQAGDTTYNAAPQLQQSFAVGKGNQTISYTSTAPVGATVGGPTYNVSATATSGLAVTFTIDASAASVCSIAGSTVSFIAVGTCVIDANQAGDANWNAAPQLQQSFAVGKGNQTISFTSSPPASPVVGGPTYNVTATATSGLPVTLTIDASATTICSIAGSTVSFIGAGTCVIDADQPGDTNYNAAPQAQQSFLVGKGTQTIVFTSLPPSGAKVGGPTYDVTATGGASGNPVVFSINASATSICSIAGNTVSFTAVGTCVIDADQAGNANYNAALTAQQSFAVAIGDQTITYTSTAPAATVGGPKYNVTATATSGLTVTFSIDATATSVCSIDTLTNDVSFIAIGTCVIDADQGGDANWNPAPQAQQSFTVGQGSQTISFTSTAPVGAKVGGPTYTVTASATSGLPVAFTIDATATSVCSIAGNVVSFLSVGTCVIDANQAGNANYTAAPQQQQSFAVAKGDQTITFTSIPPANAQVGGPTYTVTATSSSGLTVAFTIDATATSVCSVAGSTVSFLAGGTCVIDANQAGGINYNAAPQVQQSFTVSQPPAITSANNTTFAPGKVGQTFTVTTTGFPTNASMSITTPGPLPSGVSLVNNNNGTATLGGTPAALTQAGSPYAFTITANNGVAPNATQGFTLFITCPLISVSGAGSVTAIFNTAMTPAAYGQTGGNGTITWTAPGLPAGVSIDSSGNISGTPTVTGTFSVTVTATDAGGCQGTESVSFTSAPSAVGDSYSNLVDNTQGVVTGGTTGSPSTPFVGLSGSLLANDLPAGGVAATAGTFATAGGGSVTIATDGTFIYTPKANSGAAANTSDSFTYTVTSNTGGGSPATSAPATVSLSLSNRVWYVNNSGAAGNGQSQSPFNTLASAGAASTANDIIFVYNGNGTNSGQNAGIALKNGQQLLGEANGLTVNALTLVAVGSRPVIGNAGGDGVTITNVTGVFVKGLAVAGSANAINMTSSGANTLTATVDNVLVNNAGTNGIRTSAASSGTSTVTVQNSTVSAATGNGIDARTAAGAGTLLLNINNDVVTATGNGILIDGSAAGTTTITGFANISVGGNTGGSGILVTSAIFDATPGVPFSTVSGGTTVIGASGNGVGASGMVLTNVSGDLSFTDLDIFADGGAGLRASGTTPYTGSAGFQIAVGAGVASITAVGGPAVDLSTVKANSLPFATISSTNSATTGVALNSLLGTFSAGVGSSISNSTGTGFQVGSSNATISYAGTINTTTGKGVDLTTNTGSTISFTGAMTISSGANTAFNATGGGTVTATNTTSTLTSTTGTALNVANTTIGASGLNFRSITAGTAASGPANGIVLNNTGASGGLTITGNSAGACGGNVGGGPLPGTPLTTTAANSADCTGGTIQKATNAAISLTSTVNVSLTRVHLTNNTHYGILGSSVSGFTLTDSLIDGTNGSVTGSAFDGSINFQNLTGSASITRAVITGGFYNNITVKNDSATPLNRITLDKTQTGSTNVNNNDNINFESLSGSSAVIKATVQNSVLTAAAGDLLQYANNGNANGGDIVLTNSQLSNNHPLIATGGGGVSISGGAGGDDTFQIDHSTFRDSVGSAVLIVKPSSTAHTYVGTFDSNRIGVTGVANSGSLEGSGLKIQTIGGGVGGTGGLTATVTNNVIQQYNNDGMTLQAGGGAPGDGTGFFNATATSNTVGPLGTNTAAAQGVGVRVTSGTASGDSFQSCAKIALNTLTNSGITGTPSDYRVRQRFSTTVRLPGYSNTPGNTAAVVSFLDSNNTTTAVPGGTATADYPATGGGFTGTGTTCP